MILENNRKNKPKNTDAKHDAEAEFHIALGWLAALSVSIAAAALAAIS